MKILQDCPLTPMTQQNLLRGAEVDISFYFSLFFLLATCIFYLTPHILFKIKEKHTKMNLKI